jgi:hypothetical protein
MLRRQSLLALVSLLAGCSLSAAATGAPADEPPDAPQDAPEAGPTRPPQATGDSAPAQVEAPGDDAEDEEPAQPNPAQPGAPSSRMMDASMQHALDASLRADAGRDGSAYNGAVPRICEGASALGSCWYLGARGLSCEQACSEHGGFDPASIALVGTRAQGGTLENCAAVMSELGVRSLVVSAVRLDGVGIGCHRWASLSYWLAADTVLYTGSSSAPLAELACACNH